MRKVMIPLTCGLSPEDRQQMERIFSDILDELTRGDAKYGRHPGPKRAFGTLRNEFNELQTEMEAEDSRPSGIREEAVQVGAMAVKLIRDYCDRRQTP